MEQHLLFIGRISDNSMLSDDSFFGLTQDELIDAIAGICLISLKTPAKNQEKSIKAGIPWQHLSRI